MTRKVILMSTAVAVSTLLANGAFAASSFATTPAGWSGVGSFGTGTADGDITAAPTASGGFTFVTTDVDTGAVNGVGGLPGVGGTGAPENGSTLTTSSFASNAGDTLQFYFNYLTSDGAGFADYGWARLLDASDNEVALLFTARTTIGGDTVPGFEMPVPAATLSPMSVLINDNATTWSAIGADSGTCFDVGCGSTGWVESNYTIADAGNYSLQFGITNWDDGAFQSAMAIAGANIGGVAVDPNDPPTNTPQVPLPAAGWMLLAGLGGLAGLRRRKKAT